MENNIDKILSKKIFDKKNIITLLSITNDEDKKKLFDKAYNIKKKHVGNYVHLRGLLEFSNICTKNCKYCGIRSDNKKAYRYDIPDDEIKKCVLHAWENGYGSMVFQSGERKDKNFIEHLNDILIYSKKITNNEIGITLSCGEQSAETYKKWFELGAHRYLLRIETTNEDLYYKIHPKDKNHSFQERIQALKDLKNTGYQTGTGVMIGLPFQTIEDLADDLIFFKDIDIDMVGMGPYIEHKDTPLYNYKDMLMPQIERFNLTIKMIAILRIMMKDINIASSTALQAIVKNGRMQGLKAGTNVIMPNLTPTKYIENYFLYENKPCLKEYSKEYFKLLEKNIIEAGDTIQYYKWGDPIHYFKRNSI
ncbi:MAG: [FeFe] hydrogenase H-cluster radical SAM maturase HydE [Bacteroidetes bacterium]|nr:[FeFe] hydrogenase H-cluster radical SAM maturase HydE [Bacteroidota bacterium]